MKKLACVIFGSPREHGNTRLLLDAFLKYLKGYDIKIIDAYEKNVHACVGCLKCEKSGHCIYNDMDDIDYLLRNSDLLIVATPVYNLSFPSPLKAIFDRMQIYFSQRFSMNIKPPIKKHKKAVLLLTQGSNDDRAKDIIETQLRMIFTIINAELVSTVSFRNTDKNAKIQDIMDDIEIKARMLSEA